MDLEELKKQLDKIYQEQANGAPLSEEILQNLFKLVDNLEQHISDTPLELEDENTTE